MGVTIGALSHGFAALAFLVLTLLLVFSWRGRAPGAMLALASLATTAWAALSGYASVFPPVQELAGTFDLLRVGGWLVFLFTALLTSHRPGVAPSSQITSLAAFVGTGLLVLLGLSAADPDAWVILPGGRADSLWPILVRVVLALVGLALVEHLYRNSRPEQRWGVKHLCLGVGALFAFDFYLYADALLFRKLSPELWAARGVANGLVVPLLALSAARNPQWSLDLFVSRQIVFHSATLLGAGIYLLLMAAAGYYIRYFGGDWGGVLQATFLFGALLLLMMMLFSGTLRSRVKVFVSKNFFAHYFDYREEWLKFTRRLSEGRPGERLQDRSIQAIAELVDSPGGALWLTGESGLFERVAHWNMPAAAGTETPDGPLAAFLARTQWVVSLDEHAESPQVYEGFEPPAWLSGLPEAWLVVPLIHQERLLGWVVLARSRAPQPVNWELRDLLKTAGRQAASYLAQLEAAQALMVARQFESFNRMSAFVIHDIKNVAAQLSLLLANAEKHRDNPDFQADMLETVELSVGKMRKLLAQLHSRSPTASGADPVELEGLLERVLREKGAGPVKPRLLREAGGLTVLADRERLARVIGHVVQNGVEATRGQGEVVVRLARQGDYAIIEARDTGCGMDPQFIRERLFRPFETTKSSGMGIGAYEAREYVRELSGQVEVESAPGVGTTFRIRLPLASAGAVAAENQKVTG